MTKHSGQALGSSLESLDLWNPLIRLSAGGGDSPGLIRESVCDALGPDGMNPIKDHGGAERASSRKLP